MKHAWELEPGERRTRGELAADYGGGRQGGVIPSASTPNVLLFSDPSKGRAYGYDYDGWAGDHFLYTGEGQLGDQTLIKGNLAIASHRERGSALRLFVAVDRVRGTNTLVHEYVGRFEVDFDQPFARAEARDREEQLRTVLVFRLNPVGDVVRRGEDSSGVRDAPKVTVAGTAPLEAFDAATFNSPGTAPAVRDRRESELAQRLQQHLEGQGHQLCRWQIQPAGELRRLYTDIYDETTNTLYEAKSSATRNAVRTAVGQLLDYRRHISRQNLRLAVVLPSRPSTDLLDLIHSVGATCVCPGQGGWEVLDQP